MLSLTNLEKDIAKLPPDAQQIIIDLVEVLKKRYLPAPQEKANNLEQNWSDFIGCLEGGSGDLATNKQHLEGFGKK